MQAEAEDVNYGGSTVDKLLKKCTSCNKKKSISEYYVNKRLKDGINSKCKECCKEYRKERYENSKQQELEYMRNYYDKNKVGERRKKLENFYKNKEKYNDYSKVYYYKNKSVRQNYMKKYYYDNKDAMLSNTKKWIINNKDRWKLITDSAIHNRRSRLAGLPNTLTVNELIKINDFFDNQCALTGASNDIHLDHVIPVSWGHGGTTIENIIPLRADLNISKGDKNILTWFESNVIRFNLDEIKFNKLINYLAKINNKSVEEYISHINWCEENKRDLVKMSV